MENMPPEQNEAPTVIVKDDGASYYFYCEYCKKNHRHGRLEGHRVAHCSPTRMKNRELVPTNSPYLLNGYHLELEKAE